MLAAECVSQECAFQMLPRPDSGCHTPDVSVIVVNFNAARTLPLCLHALRAQSFGVLRVIVVDNASTDGSLETVRALFPEFEYLCMGHNAGFAAANNRAIELCTSEFVVLLNPDAYPDPDWLHELVKAARALPDAASFGSRQIVADDSRLLDGVGDVLHFSGLVWRDGHGRPPLAADDIEREIFSPCAAAALYRREAFVCAGGFDESFFCYVEDVDLGFRLRLLGWRSSYVPTAVVRHVGSATSGGAHSAFSVYHGHRNIVWTFVKNVPSPLLWLLLPAHLAMNVASIIWFSLQGNAGSILRAKRDSVLGLASVLGKRAEVQRTRSASCWQTLKAMSWALIPARWFSRAAVSDGRR
jgi:GT2 family glycosyltransferase